MSKVKIRHMRLGKAAVASDFSPLSRSLEQAMLLVTKTTGDCKGECCLEQPLQSPMVFKHTQ